MLGLRCGRFIDCLVKEHWRGFPMPGMTMDWQAAVRDMARGIIPNGQQTGADGRFRYEGLVPGQEHSANAVGDQAVKGGFGVVIDRVVLKPGETRDLGDVQSRLDTGEAKP